MMSTPTEISDGRLVELIRSRESMSIAEVGEACGVTATAVRQRLTRLMEQGLVARATHRQGRGRPEHRYSVTERARRQAGNNYADLAVVLWSELRQVKHDEVRRGLLERVATQLTEMYRGQVQGATSWDRLESLLAERLPAAAVVSISNRPAVARFHTRTWSLAPGDDGVPALRVA